MDRTDLLSLVRQMQNYVKQPVRIHQDAIDVLQEELYFQWSDKLIDWLIEDNASETDFQADVAKLYSPEVSDDEKKQLLCLLASVLDTQSYREIENYQQIAPENLKVWATLALRESKVCLESYLLGYDCLYISTGLGGKDEALRYFVVLVNKDGKEYDSLQKETIKNEFEFIFKQHKGGIEDIQFNDKLACIVCLLPWESDIGDLVDKIVNECNTLGNFIDNDFLLTNIKIMEIAEINNLLQSKEVGYIDTHSLDFALHTSSGLYKELYDLSEFDDEDDYDEGDDYEDDEGDCDEVDEEDDDTM